MARVDTLIYGADGEARRRHPRPACGVLEWYVLEQISPSSLYMSPSAIAAIVLPGRRIGLRLWRHRRRWPLRGIGPIVGIAVDNLGLVGDLDAASWAIRQRDQPGSLFNRQPLLRRPSTTAPHPGTTAPIANFSLLDRYLTAT
jgi:hypothetical protein